MSQQPEASWRLATPPHLRQRVAPAPPAPPEADLPEITLPEGWIGLSDCLLQNAEVPAIAVPLVLLHPEFGVALLGVPAAQSAAAETALRMRLDAARFVAIFPGHLPVVTLSILPGDPLNLQRRLAAAFAALPPLDLAGGDGWISVVQRALMTRAPIRLARPGVEAANLPPRASRPAAAWRGWVWPMAGLTTVALLVGLVLGLTHQPAGNAPILTGAEAPPEPDSSQAGGRAGGAPPVAPPPVAQLPGLAAPTAPAPMAPSPPPAPRTAARPAPPVAADPTPSGPTAAPPASAANTPAANSLPRVLVRSPANVRAAPDGRATVLRTAPRGEAFRVHGESKGWLQVGNASPEGWIFAGLLSDPAP